MPRDKKPRRPASPFDPKTDVHTREDANFNKGPTEVAPRPKPKARPRKDSWVADDLEITHPGGGLEKQTAVAPNPLDVEVTALDALPKARPSGGLSPVTEVVSLIGDKRPDLVEFLVNLDKESRSRAENKVRTDLKAQDERLGELADRVRALIEAEQQHGDHITKLLRAVEQERQAVAGQSNQDHQATLEEARAVNKNYKGLLDKVVAERDGMTAELKQLRAQYAADAREHAQSQSRVHEEIARERREAGERVNKAEAQAEALQQRIREMDGQVREALDSRDRIAERVRTIEERLEREAIPLRVGLEEARAREERLMQELDKARKEIGNLKLLAKSPH